MIFSGNLIQIIREDILGWKNSGLYLKKGEIVRSAILMNNRSILILLDPGVFCMHKILTHKTLIFVFQGPSGVRKIWVFSLNFPDFFYGPFFNLLNSFSHRVHQLPNY